MRISCLAQAVISMRPEPSVGKILRNSRSIKLGAVKRSVSVPLKILACRQKAAVECRNAKPNYKMCGVRVFACVETLRCHTPVKTHKIRAAGRRRVWKSRDWLTDLENKRYQLS
jgi:hypothetical protein